MKQEKQPEVLETNETKAKEPIMSAIKSKPVWIYVIVGVVAGLVIAGAAFAGYKLFYLEDTVDDVVSDVEDDVVVDDSGDEDQSEDESGTDSIAVEWLGQAEPAGKEMADILKSIKEDNKKYCGVEMSKKNFNYDCDSFDDNIYWSPSIYKIGTIKSPQDLAGKTIYYLFVGEEGMGTYYRRFRVIYNEEKNRFVSFDETAEGWISSVLEYNFDELDAPSTISMPNQDYTLYLLGNVCRTSFLTSGTEGEGGVVNLETGEMITAFSDSEKVFVDENYGPVYFRDGAYQIVMPDGTPKAYELSQPYFLKQQTPEEAEKIFYSTEYLAEIDWLENVVVASDEKYQLGLEFGFGCGGADGKPCTNIVNNADWFDENNLVKIGQTKKGGSVYELNDKATNKYYKELFDFGYAGSKGMLPGQFLDEKQTSTEEENYQEFLNDYPLFFWQDYRGDWRAYRKSKYKSMAECGKPVVYLYPEKAMDVNVKVEPSGGFKITEPLYLDNGWTVRATPDSQLYNYANKTIYPYLFWEGYGYDYVRPDYGFVMSQKEVGIKMPEILAKIGLNEQETKDFLEFWQSKLEVKPYVFVTFLPQREFDKLAPLSVDPQADTVIRVFMDYQPLDEPIKVVEPRIRTPKRNGFTVVEWGGKIN